MNALQLSAHALRSDVIDPIGRAVDPQSCPCAAAVGAEPAEVVSRNERL